MSSRSLLHDRSNLRRPAPHHTVHLVPKDTLNLDDLDWDEAMRIRFAKQHFAAAPAGVVDYLNTMMDCASRSSWIGIPRARIPDERR